MPHKGKGNEAGGFILGATKTSLQMLQQVAGTIPVPGINAAVASALQVVTIIDAIKTNREDREALIKRITELMLVIVVPLKGKNPKTFPSDLVDNIGHLSSTLSQIVDDLRTLQEANLFQTMLNYTAVSGKIKACSAKLDWAVRQFQVRDVISNAVSLFRLLDFTRDALIETLPRAKSASHRSGRPGAPTPCFKDTRAEILEVIARWATNTDENAPDIFWLTGVAGIGKSTIAQSIALLAYEHDYLGASYFFSRRGDADLSDPRKFFPTLAYDLARFDPEFAKLLGDSLGGSTDACYHNYQEQAQTLLIEPLKRISKRQHPILLVVDALDECEAGGIQAILPLLIASQAQCRFPMRILFTGRPEPHLRAAFDSSLRHQKLILHDAELALVQSDIKLYLEDGLQAITSKFSMSARDQWFDEDELNRLVENAKCLFVYAYTALCFIGDPRVRNPQRQLSILLTNRTEDDNPYSVIDRLYTEIIQSALHCDGSNYVTKRFLDVVGFLVFRRDALSIGSTDELLGERGSISYVRDALEDLGSIIVVPSADKGSPQIYHESFRDYITTSSRCPSIAFISESAQEGRLAIRCFLVMKVLLKKGIAIHTEQEKSGTSGVASLPAHLIYACRFWASHLSSTPSGEAKLVSLLIDFASLRILWWLEVMSHTQNIPSAIKALTSARKWAANSSCPETLITLLNEAYRFTCAFLQPLAVAPIHIYTSAIPVCPRETAFWKTYCFNCEVLTNFITEDGLEWSACISMLYGHTASVATVAFSPNGEQLASGSDDCTVRIWDVSTGASIATLRGHTSEVKISKFSSDGARLISGSVDGALKIWDVASRVCVRTMQASPLGVSAMAISSSGSKWASASRYHDIQIWEMTSGESTNTVRGHSSWIGTLAFSPDEMRLASGSRDTTIELWDVALGVSLATLQGHTNNINIVTFSYDNTRLASGSDDTTVRIWEVTSGACVGLLQGHAHGVYSIAFFPDSSRLASGSSDGKIYIWNVASRVPIPTQQEGTDDNGIPVPSLDGPQLEFASSNKEIQIWGINSEACISVMQGHTGRVHAMAFSPDGSRLASGSSDATTRIWDPTSQASASSIQGHSEAVYITVLSHDGAHLASGSEDRTVRLWNVISGATTAVLRGHTSGVYALEFSPDATRLASGSADETIKLWNVDSGASTVTLRGHTSYVRIIRFSPDGSQLASGSGDRTVRIWDVSLGACISTLQGHTNCINAIAFSSRGTMLASGSYDNSVQIWDLASGESIAPLQEHEEPVDAVAFSPNGIKLASGSYDKTVRLWDIASGTFVAIPHPESVTGVAFSVDGATLWITSETTTSIHDAADGSEYPQDDPELKLRVSGTRKSAIWPTHLFNQRPPAVSPVFYEDYWLRSRKDGRSICHIPADYPVRTEVVSKGNLVAAGCTNGRVLLLRLSDAILAHD